MSELNLALLDTPRVPASVTARDWVAVGFRHGRLMAVSFLAVFLGVLLITWLIPPQYESQIKILVKRERVDPVVSPDQNTQSAIGPGDMTELDLNSEVELLKGRDILEKVVIATGLQTRSRKSLFARLRLHEEAATDETTRTLRAVRELENRLDVEPLKKTKLIRVSYQSPDPQLSAKVLQTLIGFYMEKHLQVHRLPGALGFFQNQTHEYQTGLANAEKRLAEFGGDNGVVAAQLEKELAVRKLTEFEAESRQTQAAIAETKKRIAKLEEQEALTPARLTTQVRTADNPLLLQQMKSALLNLELKRTELLTKFAPDYRPVQEVETQIKQTKEALAAAETNPVREETSDRDTTHEWIKGELAKAHAELSALQARVTATSQTITAYREKARTLNHSEIMQQDLVRSVKTAEENFLLYTRKQEEARISDALDQQRIVNVSLAEEATVPALPSSPNWLVTMFIGTLLACFTSVGLALTLDYLDRSFRTPDEVEIFLNVPVLAALPEITS
jgi:uncharacterized protein involved in exopolysaccharide biosynthesis